MATDNFRSVLAIYDTAAKIQGIDLAAHVKPCGWPAKYYSDLTSGWGQDDSQKVALWADDQFMWSDKTISEWGYCKGTERFCVHRRLQHSWAPQRRNDNK